MRRLTLIHTSSLHPSSLIGCRGEAPPERTAISQATKSAERNLIVESTGTTSPRGADPAALSGKWNEPWWIVRPCARESGADAPLTLETVSRRLPFTAATVGMSARAPTYSRPCRIKRQRPERYRFFLLAFSVSQITRGTIISTARSSNTLASP